MSISSLFDSAILGVIEGLTEFIPVSSTGHLIIGEAFLKRPDAAAKVFDIFIQIGAILAVIWARRQRVARMAIGCLNNPAERAMALKILVAFIPAVIAGIPLYHFIKTTLFTANVVGAGMIAGGVIMILIERRAPVPRAESMDAITMKTALGIGICQLAALIPGISRSGASIVGAQLLGVERRAATEFSFFLAIPTIFGAAAFDLYKNLSVLGPGDIPVFAVGIVSAFVSALFVVNRLIDFVGKHGFTPFGYYRIAAGALVLLLVHAGRL